MRGYSVSQLKGRATAHTFQPYPATDTRGDVLLKRLNTVRPAFVLIEDWKRNDTNVIQALIDNYGMDIIRHPTSRRSFALIGEWVGKVYIDYTQEKKDA